MASESQETLQVGDDGFSTIGRLELKDYSVKLLSDNSRPNYDEWYAKKNNEFQVTI